jgi:methionine-gamma-lyase
MKQPIGKMGHSTLAIHGGCQFEDPAHALSMPLYLTSTFAFESARDGAQLFAHRKEGFIYSRLGNPTVEARSFIYKSNSIMI